MAEWGGRGGRGRHGCGLGPHERYWGNGWTVMTAPLEKPPPYLEGPQHGHDGAPPPSPP